MQKISVTWSRSSVGMYDWFSVMSEGATILADGGKTCSSSPFGSEFLVGMVPPKARYFDIKDIWDNGRYFARTENVMKCSICITIAFDISSKDIIFDLGI